MNRVLVIAGYPLWPRFIANGLYVKGDVGIYDIVIVNFGESMTVLEIRLANVEFGHRSID